MASDIEFVQHVVDQVAPYCEVTYRKMFGEYCVYLNGKVVGLICDNRLLVKATDVGKAYIGDYVEAEPYPGAKLALLIEDKLEDGEWLAGLLIASEKVLPKPKPRKKKVKKD